MTVETTRLPPAVLGRGTPAPSPSLTTPAANPSSSSSAAVTSEESTCWGRTWSWLKEYGPEIGKAAGFLAIAVVVGLVAGLALVGITYATLPLMNNAPALFIVINLAAKCSLLLVGVKVIQLVGKHFGLDS